MSNVVKMSDYQTKEVVIDGITVKQDAEGRYSLNDVHVASGTTNTYAPAQWARQAGAALIRQLNVENPTFDSLVAKRGRNGGTYAVEDLVYSYAMWISPEYHLKVVRAYKRLATEGVAVHDTAAQDLLDNPLKYLQALMGQAQKLVEDKARLALHQDMDHRAEPPSASTPVKTQ